MFPNIDVMTEMGQDRPARPEAPGRSDRLGYGKMGIMGMKTEGVDDQRLDPGQRLSRRLRYAVAISQIGEIADPVPERLAATVEQRQWDDREVLYVKTCTNLHPLQLGTKTAVVIRLEDVTEVPINARQGGRRSIDRDRFVGPQIEDAQLIDAVHIVGVGMGVKDRVDPADILAQRLKPQIGRSIDQDIQPRTTQQDAATRPLVAGVLRTADRAIATDDRNPGAGARTENDSGAVDCDHALKAPTSSSSAAVCFARISTT